MVEVTLEPGLSETSSSTLDLDNHLPTRGHNLLGIHAKQQA